MIVRRVILSSFLACMGFLATLMPGVAQPPETQQVWLGGVTPYMQMIKHRSDPSDYMALFQPGSPWPVSGAGLAELKIPAQMADHGSEEDLRAIIAGLKQRHIGLSIEMGLLHGPVSGCGWGIEGFSSANGPLATMERIKRLGGVVDYIDMDEPVLYGHRPLHKDGTGGCQYPIATLADQVAEQISAVRSVFPNIQVGDAEPIGAGADGMSLNSDVLEFFAALKQRTQGAAPAFFHADVQWNSRGWRPVFEELGLRLHAQNVPVGVICDGGGPGITDSDAWIANALRRYTAVAGDRAIGANQYIVQTWEALPTKMLPENDPGAMTYEVKRVINMLQSEGSAGPQ